MVGRPYSEEFRRRVLEEVAEGNSRRGAARRFKVGASSAIRWKKRLDATGSAARAPRAGKSRSPLEAHAPWLMALIAAEPDLSLAELTQRVQAELGQKTSASAMDRFVQRHGLSFKKLCTPPSRTGPTSLKRVTPGRRTRRTSTPTNWCSSTRRGLPPKWSVCADDADAARGCWPRRPSDIGRPPHSPPACVATDWSRPLSWTDR